MSIMATELLDLQLAFRALSDEDDVDGVELDDNELEDEDGDLGDDDEDGKEDGDKDAEGDGLAEE